MQKIERFPKEILVSQGSFSMLPNEDQNKIKKQKKSFKLTSVSTKLRIFKLMSAKLLCK